MAEQTIPTKLKLRHDIASNWTTKNPVLLEGEVGFETDTLNFKVGNGTSAWNDLAYYIPTKYMTTDTEQTITARKTITELATSWGGVIVSQNGYYESTDGKFTEIEIANTFGNKEKYSVIESKKRPQAILPNRQNEDLAFLSDLDKMYPVGSIYMTTTTTTTGVVSPASFLGGTWARIKDKFLLGAGDTYVAGDEGGSADAVVVKHRHNLLMYVGVSTGSYNGIPPMTAKPSSSSKTTEAVAPISEACDDNGNIVGVDGTGKNMPPYLVVYMWERIPDEVV